MIIILKYKAYHNIHKYTVVTITHHQGSALLVQRWRSAAHNKHPSLMVEKAASNIPINVCLNTFNLRVPDDTPFIKCSIQQSMTSSLMYDTGKHAAILSYTLNNKYTN